MNVVESKLALERQLGLVGLVHQIEAQVHLCGLLIGCGHVVAQYDGLETNDLVDQLELPLEFRHRFASAEVLQIHVDPAVMALDLVRQATPAPKLDIGHRAGGALNRVVNAIGYTIGRLFVDGRPHDVDGLVFSGASGRQLQLAHWALLLDIGPALVVAEREEKQDGY